MIITQGRGVDEVVRSDDTIYAFQYLVSISLLLGDDEQRGHDEDQASESDVSFDKLEAVLGG